jgi:hypothetical protein
MRSCCIPFKRDVVENLNLLLINRFDEILEVISIPEAQSFDVYVRTGVVIPVFISKLNHYLDAYLQASHMDEMPVYFNVYQNRGLMNYLHYNDSDREFVLGLQIDMELQSSKRCYGTA